MVRSLESVRAYGNAIIIISLATYFFVIPFGTLISALREPGLYTGEMSPFLYRWHRQLSQRFEPWALARVDSNRASSLSLNDISGTEWPIFSAVFYLWSTEALQDAWEDDPSLYSEMPGAYARGAIEAAASLTADPKQAAWVKEHWGDDYLYQENIFYRMLLISGLTSYQKLLGDERYERLLRDQVESLSTELDNSPFGLLDDYPGQCYPIDILPAIAAVKRADEVLVTDHTEFVDRALRAFADTRLDARTGLPAYVANSKTGTGIGPARGVGISYMLIWAPELWPEVAQDWTRRYENHFWQEGWMVAGIREFSRDSTFDEWLIDVDAGPVVAGYGTAASAFGIGASRKNGRLDLAYPLSAEALVTAWPLGSGTLLGARMLSNLSDAPYIGESILLFNFTREPNAKSIVIEKGRLPFVVYLGMSVYVLIGSLSIGLAIRSLKRWQKQSSARYDPEPGFQLIIWIGLTLAGMVILVLNKPFLGILFLLAAQLFRGSRTSAKRRLGHETSGQWGVSNE